MGNLRKVLSVLLALILIINLVFFGLGKTKDILFWSIIGLCALSSYLMAKFFR